MTQAAWEYESPTKRSRQVERPNKYAPHDPAMNVTVTSIEIQCCGRWLEVQQFINTCPRCGADYGPGGYRLAPREQWGSETGESLSDILNYKNYDPDEDW